MKRLHLIIYILMFSLYIEAQMQIKIMSLNCENAFDTRHDEGKDDYEYVEGGARHWNKSRLYRKLNGIAQLVAATDTVNPVPLVALCEVENDSVLDCLVNHTPLRAIGYQYVMTDSPDSRGVDVALLYKKEKFALIDVERIRPSHVGAPTRDILHAVGIVGIDDTLDVYVVHLPSRLGGKEAADKSIQVTKGLKHNIDSILSIRQHSRVVVMGDFNAEFSSRLFRNVLHAEAYWKNLTRQPNQLYDVVERKVPRELGSYKYKGKWSTIDHILVNGALKVKDAGVLVSPFITERDESYGGIKPRRTYIGYKYNGGISDHLPVWTLLEF